MSVIFDLECIPQQEPLKGWQKDLLKKRLTSEARYLGIKLPTTMDDPLVRKTMALSPYLGQVICIGLYEDTEDKEIGLIGDEKQILEEFWHEIKDERWFISFNGLGFDAPYILIRSMLLGIKVPKVGNNTHPFLYKPKFRTKPHCDVMEISSMWNNQLKLPLGSLCEALGIKSPKEGEVKASGVEKAYLEGKIEEIKKYCLRDVKATFEVAKIVLQYTSNQN